jgi:hypothetical protein
LATSLFIFVGIVLYNPGTHFPSTQSSLDRFEVSLPLYRDEARWPSQTYWEQPRKLAAQRTIYNKQRYAASPLTPKDSWAGS